MKTANTIVMCAAIMVILMSFNAYYKSAQCKDLGGHMLEGECFRVMQSKGSVYK